ncbi:MAG: anaerobic ribonucleoside-triphosphate reductase [Thermoguttaceae bacterium]|nr:anaerobic ribonucleoside-triphosphate reductase [Thermoguttaceae bacterium]
MTLCSTESESRLMKIYEDITFHDSKSSSFKRENANINGDTSMGSMLQMGSAGAREYFLEHVLKPEHATAHKNGDIHIHDLDFYTTTTTCTQIDLLKLFKGGFSTGHGILREPNDIQSYAALACIAIQSNQNDQHGGQSIVNFDYGLAPGVAKTFRKRYRENMVKSLGLKEIFPGKTYQQLDELSIQVEKTLAAKGLFIRYLETSDQTPNKEYKNAEFEAYGFVWGNEAECKQIEAFLSCQLWAYAEAVYETERATYQAMEAVIHNLCTMNSRAGAQVPFSSINYGMDTSPEGRLVTRSVLLAHEAGLGGGETPIFPIHVFRVCDGINGTKDDPNYDLFQLACRVSAKRLFPNFVFQDAPYNKAYYKGTPETECASMGCIFGNEIITYKIGNRLFVEGISRAWDRLEHIGKVRNQGVSQYIDVDNVVIYDSHTGDFVKAFRFIRNPDQGNWKEIIFSNGRSLNATADHPLPVQEKGRTFVSDLQIGDKVPVVWKQYSSNTEPFDVDKAWLLGTILCDACYKGQLTASFGVDEMDIVQRYRTVLKDKYGLETKIVERQRGAKGHYFDVVAIGEKADLCHTLRKKFGGLPKKLRHIPNEVFEWKREARVAFLCGMIDADGYLNKNQQIAIGSTNHELAIQQLLLAQSLGLPGKLYHNHYNKQAQWKIRYGVFIPTSQEIVDGLTSEKKRKRFQAVPVPKTPEYIDAVAINDLGVLNKPSFDVETESDYFDVSGIISHNCRTRVIANVHDPDKAISWSRGNLSFTSINLPRLAMNANRDTTKFFNDLDSTLNLCIDQLLDRLEYQSRRKKKNFPFLMNGVWLDSDTLGPEDEVREVLKHGTLSVGFIGLAETLVALTGKHHGESEESQKLGLEIVAFMRKRLDEEAEERKLNFSLLATPAEGLSGRFVNLDKAKFGILPGITDREYYTNSFHVPVWYEISIADKIRIEAPYHALCNAGHITYVELDGDASKNPEAFEKIIQLMKTSGIGYGAINHPIDHDPVCGYNGIINDTCPKCGRKETNEKPFERIRRITGYLVGSLDRFNDAKRAEVADRIAHQW